MKCDRIVCTLFVLSIAASVCGCYSNPTYSIHDTKPAYSGGVIFSPNALKFSKRHVGTLVAEYGSFRGSDTQDIEATRYALFDNGSVGGPNQVRLKVDFDRALVGYRHEIHWGRHWQLAPSMALVYSRADVRASAQGTSQAFGRKENGFGAALGVSPRFYFTEAVGVDVDVGLDLFYGGFGTGAASYGVFYRPTDYLEFKVAYYVRDISLDTDTPDPNAYSEFLAELRGMQGSLRVLF